MTKKELTNIKRTIKKVTGRNMNSFEVEEIGYDFAVISYYQTNYDRVTNNKTRESVIL